MTSWPDVALAMAGAPVGALIAVIGVSLTNRSTRAALEQQLIAELERESTAARLNRRDTVYEQVTRDATRLFLSFRPVQDYGHPDRDLMNGLLEQEASLMVSAPSHVLDAVLAYVDRSEELLAVLKGGYPFAYLHGGEVVDTTDTSEQQAYEQAAAAYRHLVAVIRKDLRLSG